MIRHDEKASRPTPTVRCLIVTYTFPPMGGAGVQRALGFCRYLGRYGCLPTVLTVKEVAYHARDESLLSDVPETVPVLRAGSADPLRLLYLLRRATRLWRPDESGASDRSRVRDTHGVRSALLRGYRRLKTLVFFIDPQLLWLPFAVAKGVAAVRERQIQVVVAMPQPNSAALVGYLISRITGIPLVVDMRDPWTQCPYSLMPTRFHRICNDRLERTVLQHASWVSVISSSMRRALESKYPRLGSRVSVVTNGFDGAPNESALSRRSAGSFRLTHVGSLYDHHAAALEIICEALASLDASQRERLTFEIVGRVEGRAANILERSDVASLIEFVGYVERARAAEYMRRADLLLLLIKPDLDPTKDVITIPGKLFEYLAARRPVLYVGPECEVGPLIESCELGRRTVCEPTAVAEEIRRRLGSTRVQTGSVARIERYSREYLAGELAAGLHNVVGGRAGARP